jgi:hypothetical protein
MRGSKAAKAADALISKSYMYTKHVHADYFIRTCFPRRIMLLHVVTAFGLMPCSGSASSSRWHVLGNNFRNPRSVAHAELNNHQLQSAV